MDGSIFFLNVIFFRRWRRGGFHLGIRVRNFITLCSITIDFLCRNTIEFFHLGIGAHQCLTERKRIRVPGADIGEKFAV